MNPLNKSMSVNELTLHYLDWENIRAKPMVLLHGLCNNAHYWDFFAEKMSHDYHVIAIDQRGHGYSDWAESYGPRDYVLDLESTIDQLNIEDVFLIGHSIAGITASLYSALHPDKVAKLVIVDIGPELSDFGIQRLLDQWQSEPYSFKSRDEAISLLRRNEPRYSEEFIQHQMKHLLQGNEDSGFTFKYDKALHNTILKSPEWLWEYLDQIICPTLILHGKESDMLTREVADRMAERLIMGSVIDIDNAGHSILGDNPAAFTQATLNFLHNNN